MGRFLFLFLKGVWIGGTLTIPGVSGGTMAMILGIYEQLVSAVNGLVSGKERWQNLRFLIVFSLGGILGIFAFSGAVHQLLVRFPMEMVFFFVGAVAGGIPAIIKEMGTAVFRWYQFFYFVGGIFSVVMIASIPQGSVAVLADGGILWRFLGGLIAAVALVLPGISVSHLLYVLGIYESLMLSIAKLEVLKLIPFGVGLLAGIFLTTKLIEKLLARFRVESYLAILGFAVGSVFEMFTKVRLRGMTVLCPILLFLGFLVVYCLSKTKKADA